MFRTKLYQLASLPATASRTTSRYSREDELITEPDDLQVGILLSRREALVLLGFSGAALLAGCNGASGARRETEVIAEEGLTLGTTPLPSCVVRPQQTEGPYFVDERLNRSDIRSDPTSGAIRAGAVLQLGFIVSRVDNGACTPLPGAQIDVWQCDASGIYSDVVDPGFDTTGQKFLRGYQLTDSTGRAQFTTIYPGWYQGRTVHIHFKIRTEPTAGRGTEFISQLYFDDALTDRVHAGAPYAGRGPRTTRNARDGIFRRGGEQLMLAVADMGEGYAGTFNIGLQLG